MPTILVADDNSNIQKMVSLVFKEKGIRVVAVGNGEAACRKVPEVHPDVVLADVFMPVRNGYEVCEFVKQDPEFAETPVILLVGAFDPLDEKEAQRVGANGVLKKPFVPPEPLITMVSSLLKIEAPPEEEPAPVPQESFITESPAPSGPTARQQAIASAQAQYAETDDDETVTTFGAPVAAPKSQANEVEEDDSEPASEWAKRRASMDYEIDAADSADLVEKLAAEGSVEEPEIQPANKHVPFGGANIPEMLTHRPPEPEISSEPASTSAPNAEITEEFSLPPVAQDEEISAHVDEGNAPKYEGSEMNLPASFLRVQPPSDLEIHETSAVAPADSHDAKDEAPFAASPEIYVADPAAEIQMPSLSEPFESFEEPETKPLVMETASPEPFAPKATGPALTAPAETHATPSGNTLPSVTDIDAPADETTANSPLGEATVDDVIAKVMSKLEPQLHQALANGVLRPLVEEVLNQKRGKK